MSFGEYRILQALTEFLPRILEQSILDTYYPSLNTTNHVQFLFKNWQVGMLDNFQYHNSHVAVQIFNADSGILIRITDTIQQCSEILGVSITQIYHMIGSIDGFYSPGIGIRVAIAVQGGSLGHKIARQLLKSNTLEGLPGGLVSEIIPGWFWLFKADFTTYIGPFPTITAAYQFANPEVIDYSNQSKFQRPIALNTWCVYRNKESLMRTQLGKFYLVGARVARGSRGQVPTTPWSY